MTETATRTVPLTLTGKPVKRESKVVETPEFIKFARRILRAAARRVGDRDIEGLTELVMLRGEIDAAIDAAVVQLRSVDGGAYSYTDIGRVLGVTRQAAQQRFSKIEKESAR